MTQIATHGGTVVHAAATWRRGPASADSFAPGRRLPNLAIERATANRARAFCHSYRWSSITGTALPLPAPRRRPSTSERLLAPSPRRVCFALDLRMSKFHVRGCYATARRSELGELRRALFRARGRNRPAAKDPNLRR